MRAAFYNPDRAVDFLLNGIPESAQRELDQATQRPSSTGQQQQAQQATSQQPSGADITAAGTTQPNPPATGDEPVNLFEAAAAQNQGGRGSGNTSSGTTTTGDGSGLGGQAAAQGGNLEFLRNNPMFVQLRNLVQSQPQMLEQVLHQVSAANPQLAQLISQNPQQFLEMLTEGGEGEGGERMVPPGVREVSVTEEERDAIERVSRYVQIQRFQEKGKLILMISSAAWVSSAISSSKLTLRATRMKSLRPTSYSIIRVMRTMEVQAGQHELGTIVAIDMGPAWRLIRKQRC